MECMEIFTRHEYCYNTFIYFFLIKNNVISSYILGFCNATWDGFLCWPFTQPGVQAKQLCPENVKGILRGRK